jgi:hypothetical protein
MSKLAEHSEKKSTICLVFGHDGKSLNDIKASEDISNKYNKS